MEGTRVQYKGNPEYTGTAGRMFIGRESKVAMCMVQWDTYVPLPHASHCYTSITCEAMANLETPDRRRR